MTASASSKFNFRVEGVRMARHAVNPFLLTHKGILAERREPSGFCLESIRRIACAIPLK